MGEQSSSSGTWSWLARMLRGVFCVAAAAFLSLVSQVLWEVWVLLLPASRISFKSAPSVCCRQRVALLSSLYLCETADTFCMQFACLMQLRETGKKTTHVVLIPRAILLLCRISTESEAALLKLCRYMLVMQGAAMCSSTLLLLCCYLFLLYFFFAFGSEVN